MQKLNYSRSLLRAALAAVLCSALSGCGALVTADAVRGYVPPEKKRDSQVVAVYGKSYEPAPIAAGRFAAMAVFAQAVYRDDLPAAERWGAACKYLEPGAEVPTVGMPTGPEGRWSRWTGHKHACMDEAGLAYETYIYQRSDGKVTAAVIAFRGTENVRDELAQDWGSNLLVAFGIEPPQYQRAQDPVKKLAEALNAAWEGVPIYAVGHSLGGGLAQQAGYLSARIRAVYAFNSSPVTNWSHLTIKERLEQRKLIEQHDPQIHRVYHGKEVLAQLRDVAGRLVSRDRNRVDYEFFFDDGKTVELHSMSWLACNLALAFKGSSDEFWLTRSFAEQVTGDAYPAPGKSNPICTDETRARMRKAGLLR